MYLSIILAAEPSLWDSMVAVAAGLTAATEVVLTYTWNGLCWVVAQVGTSGSGL